MLTDQQIDEFLDLLAKSPTSARDMVRGLFAAHEAKAAPAVPVGLPLHRCTNCQAIYQDQPPTQCDCMPDKQEYEAGFASFPSTPAPSQPAVPQGEPVAFAWRAKKGQPSAWQVCFDLKQADDAEVLAKTEIRFMSWTTPAAPSQEPVNRPQNCGTSFCSCIECVCEPEPVTLTDTWLLEQFKHHPNWELSTSNDPECDPSVFWLVHEVKGGRNDREWFLIGEGESPRAAIIAALREKEKAQ